jgi:hypothetical protein
LAKELVLNPSPQEAEVFGSFVMSGDQTESVFYELAPVYTLADWWRRLIYNMAPHEDVWHAASVARGNFIVRTLLGPGKLTLIRKIRKIPTKLKSKFLTTAIKTT